MTASPQSVAAIGAELGEGPVWDTARGVLWFVDIKGRRVHRFNPNGGQVDSWHAPREIGWVLPASDDTLLAGLQGRIARFDHAAGTFTPFVDVEAHLPGNRLNDATVAPDGTLWFGTMDNAEAAATGRLYRLTASGARDSGLPAVTITNGPAFSPDGRTLYHTDTLSGIIYAVRLSEAGEVESSRPFATIDPADGYPDGTTVDAEGCVWTGLFGGWAVRRYAPDGELIATVRFPVANITKVAFGGPGLRTAYATTARKGLGAAALKDQPLAGDLFAFDAGVAGLPAVRVTIPD